MSGRSAGGDGSTRVRPVGRSARLRRVDGRPALRVRLTAALIVLGLLALTAPLVVFPLIGWMAAHT